ncbi:class I SAM-dependent methyltransferase [Thiolapillus sp.]|uniref:class I SAM-dependent methyltransferase n=1 Tax=Thiolapillus sp. TaxID=2017437 RepID=UPI003AF96609
MVSNPYSAVQKKLQLAQALPYTEHWSAAPDFLELLIDHCLENKPGRILECSSGLSTLVLARCCQINQCGQVVSLENGAEFAADTRRNLHSFSLADYASVIHAPLVRQQPDDTQLDWDWYSLDSLPEDAVDLLVIDGPPGYIQHHSRYPALPLLHQQLSRDCTVFLDDAGREEEKEIVALWLQRFPTLQHRFVGTERGCSILQFRPD